MRRARAHGVARFAEGRHVSRQQRETAVGHALRRDGGPLRVFHAIARQVPVRRQHDKVRARPRQRVEYGDGPHGRRLGAAACASTVSTSSVQSPAPATASSAKRIEKGMPPAARPPIQRPGMRVGPIPIGVRCADVVEAVVPVLAEMLRRERELVPCPVRRPQLPQHALRVCGIHRSQREHHEHNQTSGYNSVHCGSPGSRSLCPGSTKLPIMAHPPPRAIAMPNAAQGKQEMRRLF
jgi:hypothetical protein